MTDWIGWVATGVFVSSYFLKNPLTLRRVQALGACIWLAYGIAVNSAPIIVTNILVATIAMVSSRQRGGAKGAYPRD